MNLPLPMIIVGGTGAFVSLIRGIYLAKKHKLK